MTTKTTYHIGLDASPTDFAIAIFKSNSKNKDEHVLRHFRHVSRPLNMDNKEFIWTITTALRILHGAFGERAHLMIEKAIDPNKRPLEFAKHDNIWNFNQELISESEKIGFLSVKSYEPNQIRDIAGLKWRHLADAQEIFPKKNRKLIKHICYDLIAEKWNLKAIEHRSYIEPSSGYVHVDQANDEGLYDIADAICCASASINSIFC